MTVRLIFSFFSFSIFSLAEPPHPSSSRAQTVSDQSPIPPIPEIFRTDGVGKIKIRLWGQGLDEEGIFYVPTNTTFMKLWRDANTIDSPMRTNRLASQILVMRDKETILPWTRFRLLSETKDAVLKGGDAVGIWSLCFGP